MSLELRVSHLEDLVAQLTLEVRELRTTLRAEQEDSEASFAVISEPPPPLPATLIRASVDPVGSSAPPTTPRVGASGLPSAWASPAASPPASQASPGLSAAERAAACREIGLFLRRCLAGDHRGASGRDRLNLASRLWIVVRDFEGVIVCKRFSDCAALCKRGSDLGDSICIGLPARQDVIAVCGVFLGEMAEAEGPEDGEPLGPRDALAAGEGFVDAECPLLLECGEDAEGSPVTVHCIALWASLALPFCLHFLPPPGVARLPRGLS